MDSINKNQPEDNYQPLQGQNAVEKIKGLIEKSSTCFFCTAIQTGSAAASRPMSVLKVDDEGNLWFLSASDSHKNKEINADPSVQLFFQGSAHSDFLMIYGRARISTDQEKIDELWGPLLKTWFTEGKNDARITVIQVTPTDGYYWDNKHGNVVAFAKMVAGAVTGQTLDDSVEGELIVNSGNTTRFAGS